MFTEEFEMHSSSSRKGERTDLIPEEHHSRQGRRTDLQVDKEDNDVEEEDQCVWSVCGATHLGDSEPKSRCFKSDTKIVQDVYCIEWNAVLVPVTCVFG